MTLKEAKRAYKNDGGFRFTASQMVRADRLDAREEKRQRELEKEKQRRENKRKREEKAEKGRVVRQKMLDEGRIAVEDTWGKVTSSQPRLNKFFGPQPVPATRSGLRQQVLNAEDEDSRDDGARDGQKDKAQNYASNNVDPESKASEPPHNEIVVSTRNHSPSLASQRQLLCQDDQTHESTGHDPRRLNQAVGSQTSALNELKASQVNARQNISQRTPQKFKIGTIRTDPSLTPTEPTVHQARPSPKATPTAKPGARRHRGPPVPSESCILLKRPTAVVTAVRKESDWSSQHATEGQDSCARKGIKGVYALKDESYAPGFHLDEDEEDFTDGIDDETFLMLCSTQKPVADAALSLTQGTGSPHPTPEPPRCASARFEVAKANTSENLTVKSTLPAAKGPSESFSAFFNEIDDEDLIALAEKVESDLASSAMAPAPNPTPSGGKMKLPISEKQKPPKIRRRLPWDDEFAAPGPSTQALMLELVEQVEAEMLQ